MNATPEQAVAIVRCIEELRRDDGDSVTILCENPEANGRLHGHTVECCGAWTGSQEKQFSGGTLEAALKKAVEAKRREGSW